MPPKRIAKKDARDCYRRSACFNDDLGPSGNSESKEQQENPTPRDNQLQSQADIQTWTTEDVNRFAALEARCEALEASIKHEALTHSTTAKLVHKMEAMYPKLQKTLDKFSDTADDDKLLTWRSAKLEFTPIIQNSLGTMGNAVGEKLASLRSKCAKLQKRLSICEQDKARIKPGSAVIIHSLEARSELNGQRGVVLAWRSDSERYAVKVQGQEVALKPASVRLVSACD